MFNLPTEVTTTFHNEYPVPHNLDLRIQRVDARAGTIAVAAMPDLAPASGTSGRSRRPTSNWT